MVEPGSGPPEKLPKVNKEELEETLKREVEESKKLDEEVKDLASKSISSSLIPTKEAEGDDSDERSIFLKNVEFKTEPDQLKDHFKACGEIQRITIPTDRFTGNAKGIAYIEFQTKEAVQAALQMNDSLFNGR